MVEKFPECRSKAAELVFLCSKKIKPYNYERNHEVYRNCRIFYERAQLTYIFTNS